MQYNSFQGVFGKILGDYQAKMCNVLLFTCGLHSDPKCALPQNSISILSLFFLFDGTQRQHFFKIYYLGLHKCVLEILRSKQRPRRCDTSKLTQSLKMMHNFYSCLEICVWSINNENNCGSILHLYIC